MVVFEKWVPLETPGLHVACRRIGFIGLVLLDLTKHLDM